MMDKYLLMLYVSLEQERGLKQFFCDNGWTFCKTDLSKTTDKVGPLIPDIPQDSPVASEVPSTPSVKKLKKTGVQRKIGAAKQTSLPPSESEVPVESVKVQENLDGTESVNDTVETIGDDADDSTVTLYIQVDNAPDGSGDISSSDTLMQIAQQVLSAQDTLSQRDHHPVSRLHQDSQSDTLAFNMEIQDTPETVDGHVNVEEISSSVNDDSQNVSHDVGECSQDVVQQNAACTFTTPDVKLLYKCSQCHKLYNNKYSLKRHMRSHEPGIKHCGSCNQYFDTDQDLLLHNDRYHQDMQTCALCSASFLRKTTLRRHMLKRHPEQSGAQYKCPIPSCPSAFMCKQYLDDHMNIHEGKRPYRCKYCNKAFPLLTSLKSHESNHFKDSKGIPCNLCELVFQSTGALSNHKAAVHQGQEYRCHCGKVFRYKPGLAKHQESHARDHVVHAEHTYSGTTADSDCVDKVVALKQV